MSTWVKFLVGAVVIVVVSAALVGYAYLKPTESASAPITAIPIEAVPVATLPAATSVAETPTTAASTEAAAQESAATEPATEAVTVTEAPVVEAPVAEAPVAEAQAAPAERILFEIVSAESEARFIVDEILNGAPKTVVGTTDQVAGQISVDVSSPSNTQIGVIQVNARTLTTDSNMRTRTMQNRILTTDAYEFVTFTPTELTGWPAEAAVGESFTLQITGDLTVRDVTRQVVFTAEITPVSETRLEGLATTTILRSDYELTIPQVPQVAGVDDDVILEIEFVAEPV